MIDSILITEKNYLKVAAIGRHILAKTTTSDRAPRRILILYQSGVRT